MRYFAFLLFALSFFPTFSTCQQVVHSADGKTIVLHENGSWTYADSTPTHKNTLPSIKNLEIPKTSANEKIITHTGYALVYNEKHEQAKWIAYELTADETNKLFDRTDKFITDPQVTTGTATDYDYKSSGYDRGHLAPAADMGWSSISMVESFYYSNMSPQTPGFNRGIWKKLEELVRSWAVEYQSIYIVTGPVLKDGLPTIGPNEVSVPNYYYKVILDYSEPEIKGIGFLLPNASSKVALTHYAVSIDSVESLTGINFFPALPDQQEASIEKTVCLPCWTWKSTGTAVHDNENKAGVSVQCNGITKAGARCRNKTLNTSGFCYHHETQAGNQFTGSSSLHSTESITDKRIAVQCSGTTLAGNRCRRKTTNTNGRCFQHQ